MTKHQDVALTLSQLYFSSWRLKNLYKCLGLYSELDEQAKYKVVSPELENAINDHETPVKISKGIKTLQDKRNDFLAGLVVFSAVLAVCCVKQASEPLFMVGIVAFGFLTVFCCVASLLISLDMMRNKIALNDLNTLNQKNTENSFFISETADGKSGNQKVSEAITNPML
jgi:hypothetical protein